MGTEFRIVFCTAPAGAPAAGMARELVERRLAACVNVVPGVTSVYRWKDAVETDSEQLLVIKTHSRCLDRLRQALLDLHSYELPEIVAVPIVYGLPAYLAWVDENTGPE